MPGALEKIFILIPAYNEEKTIGKVIQDLNKHGYRNIIVIDDGSSDNTTEIALSYLNVIVLKHLVNLGPGSAIKSGFDYALESKADIAVTFDADGQHMAKDIISLLRPLESGRYDVVLGNRFHNSSGSIPVFKRVVLKLGTFLIFLMYGVFLHDTHNGLKAFNRVALNRIDIISSGWEYCSEIIEEIKIKKLRFIEIPVTVKYSEYSVKKGQKIYNSFYILSKMIMKWIFG